MSDREQVLAANEAFYTAIGAGDFQTMETLWSRFRDVAVYHPNWRGIDGREAVMDSWYRILVMGTPPAISAAEPVVILGGNTALVVCEEDLGDSRTIATNVFVREGGRWVLTHHQATGLPAKARRRAPKT